MISWILVGLIHFSLAFPASELDCQSDFDLQLNKKTPIIKSGFTRIEVNSTPVISVYENNKIIAKIFPRDGIATVLLDKKQYITKTDKRSYVQIQSLIKKRRSLKCELKI